MPELSTPIEAPAPWADSPPVVAPAALPMPSSAISQAREELRRAADTLPDLDAQLVAAIVRRLPFTALLDRQRAVVAGLFEAHGESLPVPPTTAAQTAAAELLAALRAIAKAEGIVVPPPGSVRR